MGSNEIEYVNNSFENIPRRKEYDLSLGLFKIEPEVFISSPSGLIVPERMISSDTFPLVISDIVDEEMYNNLADKISLLEQDPSICLLSVKLSTPGGSVDWGFAVYDLLQDYKKTTGVPIVMTVYGMAMSMGVFILQAGDYRRMSRNSMMLLHPSTSSVCGSTKDLELELAQNKVIDEIYVRVIAERARESGVKGTSEKLVKSLCGRKGSGVYLSAEEAKKYGFIDEII